VVGQSDVVHDVTTGLPLGDPVDSCDGLQQIVVFHLLVDVHHLLDGRIEAGQEHVAHDQEGNASVDLLRVVVVKPSLEVFDDINLLPLLPGLSDDRPLVGSLGRHHHRRFQKGDLPAQFVISIHGSFFFGQSLGTASPDGLGLLLPQPFGDGFVDVLPVMHRRHLRATDDLGLEAVGQDILNVMTHHVSSDCLDPLFGLHDVARRSPLLFEGKYFLVGEFPHQIIEGAIFSIGHLPHQAHVLGLAHL
jgi:hypothetical protein